MRSDTLIKTFNAPVAVTPYTLVTFAAGSNNVEIANAVADPIIGLSDSVGSQDNGRCDVIMAGVSEARVGGTVTKGDVLTTDSTGRAILASAGTDRVLGIAMADAVIGDIAAVLVAQG
jgi:hypothetical protein